MSTPLQICSFFLAFSTLGKALPPSLDNVAEKSPLTNFIVQPTRIVWTSKQGVKNAEKVLQAHSGQAVLKEPSPPMILEPGGAVVIDFGVQIAGSIELFTTLTKSKNMPTLRVRFGESVAETMAEIDERGAQNDHALRDLKIKIPWLGKTTLGPSGFRFVRIDNIDQKINVELSHVQAILTLRDIPYVGSFKSSDDRLNKIWETGAYTVHLNMQEYLWDGVKRDRLVWLGDMHPEISIINVVFGYNEVVPKSLDMIRDVTPVKQWMNGISSYSMWWVIIHEDWYLQHGNLEYLKEQKPYLTALLKRLSTYVDKNGKETLDGHRFLDWPTADDKTAVHEGLQAMMKMTMESGARLCKILDDQETANICVKTADRLKNHTPQSSGRKSPAALLSLAGLRESTEVSENVLKKDGPKDLSTFYGFYVLNALAESGDIQTGLDFISQYWGGMLDFGATTFWEDFNLEWTKNASRIDEIVPDGKDDLHGDFGAHCYIGFRHSFCHGWAGGPTAWLSENVLGIKPAAPGCKKVTITPNLGHLKWVEGTYPTPHGAIKVRHEKAADGSIQSTISLPEGIEQLQAVN
ncbi:MAG: alpha-L-rhamnosidase C-terminal domain-containing protein [Akkermansiaceae bacterium]